ncbi:MAG: response regulator transcription factor [Gemmatimonadales bacterium]
MSAIRVVIADDHQLVREGIRQVLAREEFEVVGEAGNGDEAVALLERLAPDVLLLDISMPGRTGLDVAAAARQRSLPTRILMLSVYDHPQYVVEAVRAGVRGYLRKDTEPAELRRAIKAVAAGESFFSPAVAAHLSAAVRGEAEPAGAARRLASLTRRERQVFEGVVAGSTNKEVAAQLKLSIRTVESYRESLMRKLGIYTVAGLTRLAMEAEQDTP